MGRDHVSAISEVLIIAKTSSVQCTFSRPIFPFISFFVKSKVYLMFSCDFSPHIAKLASNLNSEEV